jgi:hypothetical protein
MTQDDRQTIRGRYDEVAHRIAVEGWETFIDEPDELRIAAILRESFPETAPAEQGKGLEAEALKLASELEAAGMAELDFEWTEARRAVYAKRRAKELAAWLPIIRSYLASRPQPEAATCNKCRKRLSCMYRQSAPYRTDICNWYIRDPEQPEAAKDAREPNLDWLEACLSIYRSWTSRYQYEIDRKRAELAKEIYARLAERAPKGYANLSGHVALNLAERAPRCGYDMGGECAVDKDERAPSPSGDWNRNPAIRIIADGDQFCAILANFVNLQESQSGWGATPQEALAALQSKGYDSLHAGES